MSYVGFYINLDRSSERKALLEAQLMRLGLQHRYRRFPAAAGNALGFPNPSLTESEIGCFISHYLVLKQNRNCSTHLHVLEDDVIFSRFTESSIHQVISSDAMENYDIIFLDSDVDVQSRNYRELKERYDLNVNRDSNGTVTSFRLTPIEYIAAMSSYIVNRASIEKLLDIYEQMLHVGVTCPVDLAIRELARAGRIRIGCLFPFVTSIQLDGVNSTIVGRTSDPLSTLAKNIPRRSFFSIAILSRCELTPRRRCRLEQSIRTTSYLVA